MADNKELKQPAETQKQQPPMTDEILSQKRDSDELSEEQLGSIEPI